MVNCIVFLASSKYPEHTAISISGVGECLGEELSKPVGNGEHFNIGRHQGWKWIRAWLDLDGSVQAAHERRRPLKSRMLLHDDSYVNVARIISGCCVHLRRVVSIEKTSRTRGSSEARTMSGTVFIPPCEEGCSLAVSLTYLQ